MLVKLLNRAFVSLLDKKGYTLVTKTNKQPINITHYGEAIYSKADVCFDVDIEITCNFNQFFFAHSNWHYHTKMVEAIIADSSVEYSGSILEKYYQTYKPLNFKDLYFVGSDWEDVSESDRLILSENLNEYKYDPWSDRREKVMMSLVHEYGLERWHGTQHFGPVSRQKGELELQRLKDTYHSIMKHGHLPDQFGYVSGYFLKYNDDYRFFVLDGNHRVAVLGALQYSSIPVTFTDHFPRVIDYRDVENFPHVKSGLFSAELVRRIIRTYFEDNGLKKAQLLGLT